MIEMGIAEQNLVGVSAGLAAAGKKVFAVSPACFLTTRALEQIKNDVAYSDQPVKVVGISAGVSYGALGTTHHSLHDLAALGIRLALDDFGTGYSSLSYLRTYPIHTVKIDKSFVGEIPRNPASARLIESIIMMSRALHKHVVAEGVELAYRVGTAGAL